MNRNLTIADLHARAKQRGIKLITPKALGAHTKHRWQCSSGHQWDATPSNILTTNCPACHAERRAARIKASAISPETYSRDLAAKGLRSLTPVGPGTRSGTLLDVRCENNHPWKIAAGSVKHQDCPGCERERRKNDASAKRYDRLAEIVANQGGLLITKRDAFVASPDSITIRCSNGHEWSPRPSNIMRGMWCKDCQNGERLSVDKIQALAASRGGFYLEKKSPGHDKPVRWICGRGHEWIAPLERIRGQGSWCPHCTENKNGENAVRTIIEHLFKSPFPSMSPDWLGKGPRGGAIPLDGYSDRLRIGFEYHGGQHYKVDGRFVRDKEALEQRITLDALKRERARTAGATLIEIPFFQQGWTVAQMVAHVIEAAKSVGLDPIWDGADPDLSSAYVGVHYERFRAAVEARGGAIIGDFVNMTTRVMVRCAQQHEWPALPSSTLSADQTWCRRCDSAQKSVEKNKWQANNGILPDGAEAFMVERAKLRGGTFLGFFGEGKTTRYKFCCSEGHEWHASIHVSRHHWCRKCSDRAKSEQRLARFSQDRAASLAKVKSLVEAKGGRLLTEVLTSTKDRVHIVCSEGHDWRPRIYDVLKDQWCGSCFDGRAPAAPRR